MRAFVAVETPKPQAEGWRFARAEGHATLHFFAELPEVDVPRCREALEEATAAGSPIAIVLRGVGAFPDRGRPRVVWAGFDEGAPALRQLAERLRTALAVRGFASETRPFVPHVTLFRVRTPADLAEARRVLADGNLARAELGRGTITALELVESRLTPEGAVHTVRAHVPLPSGAPARRATD